MFDIVLDNEVKRQLAFKTHMSQAEKGFILAKVIAKHFQVLYCLSPFVHTYDHLHFNSRMLVQELSQL